MKFPIQPIEKDKNGTARFIPNRIVKFLLDNSPFNMNDIIMGDFTKEEHEQFAQLIGYSLGGFGELSYVSDDTYDTAEKMFVEGKSETESRIEYLQEKLDTLREKMKDIVTELYQIHEDDLRS